MIWTIIAAITASISAIGSAIAAIIMCRQNATRCKVDIENNILSELPQNIYNNEGRAFAFVHAEVHNLSSHPITISKCYMKIEKEKFYALDTGMIYDLGKSITIRASANTYRDLRSDDFTTFPLKLQPFQWENVFILFPDFKQTSANIVKGKIKFDYGCLLPKAKPIIIHKLPSVDSNQKL